MSNAELCRMAAARVAITALSATLFNMISLSFLQGNTDCHSTGEGKSAISGPSSGAHYGANIGEMGIRSLDCTEPERRAQLLVDP